jgi:EAL domain-containing protein (putative c-di-GMP-specific phosphodiesterase class I)
LLAVNLSRAQLQRAGLVADVRELLASCGMAPQQLQLEVTESLAAQDERVQTSLRELKSLGVKLALDDFGTGYSSLACLHLLPVDTVKIDRSFVQHAQTVDYHRVLIEATLRVAQTLGMTTVAEGIETEGQAALMLQLACDRGQGYLFAKPLDAAALQAWVCQGDSVTA